MSTKLSTQHNAAGGPLGENVAGALSAKASMFAVPAFDGKRIKNKYLQTLANHQNGCNLLYSLVSKPDQNEFGYVRHDFEIATRQWVVENNEPQNIDAVQNPNTVAQVPPLYNTVDDILTLRLDISLAANENNELQAKHTDMVKKESDTERKYDEECEIRWTKARALDHNIFDDLPDDLDADGMRDWKNKQCDEAHAKKIAARKKELADLQAAIAAKQKELKDHQTTALKQWFGKLDDQFPNEKDNEEKSPEYYDELSHAIDDSIANKQLLLEDINRVEILLLEDIKYGEDAEQRVSDLQEELKQSGGLALEKKRLESEIASGQETIQAIKANCARYKQQIADMTIAIQHESRLKELSTLNPISMLNFYKKRITGEDDSTKHVLVSIKKATSKEKKEYEARKEGDRKREAMLVAEEKRLMGLSANSNDGDSSDEESESNGESKTTP